MATSEFDDKLKKAGCACSFIVPAVATVAASLIGAGALMLNGHWGRQSEHALQEFDAERQDKERQVSESRRIAEATAAMPRLEIVSSWVSKDGLAVVVVQNPGSKTTSVLGLTVRSEDVKGGPAGSDVREGVRIAPTVPINMQSWSTGIEFPVSNPPQVDPGQSAQLEIVLPSAAGQDVSIGIRFDSVNSVSCLIRR